MSPSDAPQLPPAKRKLPDRPTIWDVLLFVIMFGLAIVLGVLLLAAALDVAFGVKSDALRHGGLPDASKPEEAWVYLAGFALFYVTAIAAIWFAMFGHRERRGLALGLLPATWRWFVFGTIGVAVLSQLADALLLPFLRDAMAIGGEELQVTTLIRALTTTIPLALSSVVVLAILAPIAEEFFFRGLLYGWIRGRLPFWATAIITSTLFGLAHGEIAHAIAAGLLGLALAYIRERSGSLWPSIVAHVVNNLVAVAGVALST